MKNKIKFMKSLSTKYSNDVIVNEYITIMINNFPILVFREYSSPHDDYKNIIISLFGFTYIDKFSETTK